MDFSASRASGVPMDFSLHHRQPSMRGESEIGANAVLSL